MEMFPIYLRRLDDRKTVIVGGDEEAEQKVEQLLDRNAKLTVISPHLNGKLQQWADANRFEWVSRSYERGDLEGAFMAIVAEFEGNINERVYEEALERGILVNVMDDLSHANFAFGSIVRQGPLTISISTSGAAPALSVRLRERFEREFGSEYGQFLEFMQTLRAPMAKYHTEFPSRKKFWYDLIDSDILSLFRKGKIEKAHHKAAEIVGKEVVVDGCPRGKEECCLK